MPYQRVTAVVALKQRKPRLRGTSLTHIPVEFLVAPEHEHALMWNDAQLAIDWPLDGAPQLSAKDAAGLPLAAVPTFS